MCADLTDVLGAAARYAGGSSTLEEERWAERLSHQLMRSKPRTRGAPIQVMAATQSQPPGSTRQPTHREGSMDDQELAAEDLTSDGDLGDASKSIDPIDLP